LRDLAAGTPGAPAHLRLFSCGGADVDPALVREAAARLGCVAKRVYGSTEFPTVTTTGPDDPPERRIDSEGHAIGANEVRLVDEEGAAVAPGREGEILARGPECFLGYRNPALNGDAFTADGWFRTGAHGARPLAPQAARAPGGGGGLPPHGEREDRQAHAARAVARRGSSRALVSVAGGARRLTAHPRGAC